MASPTAAKTQGTGRYTVVSTENRCDDAEG
jgi:hypothetical protein